MLNRKYSLILGAAIAGATLVAGEARAALTTSYAYGQQTISNLTLTGTGLVAGPVNGSATDASAATNGTGVATNDATDTLQAYMGAAPPAPQNSFLKYSTQGGGPQPGDFTRGDAIVQNRANLFGNGVSGSTVAESVTSAANGLETGASDWNINANFTSTGTSVTLNFSWANDIIAQVPGPNSYADAQFGFLATIKDQHGHEISASPTGLNTTLGAPLNGPEIITSGSGSAVMSLAGLTSGDTYTISIDAQSHSAVAVPEPASLGLIAMAALGLLGRRSRRA